MLERRHGAAADEHAVIAALSAHTGGLQPCPGVLAWCADWQAEGGTLVVQRILPSAGRT